MFRRLAELQSQQMEGFNAGNAHYNFVENQNYRYNTLIPNAIPSANTAPVPQSVNEVMRTVDPTTGRATDVLPEVNRLFVQNTVPASMRQQADTCATGSLDGLIAASGSTKGSIGCGWAYTPPPAGSAVPQTSVGALGTARGPFLFTQPSKPHAQWFWDLRQAKKQVLIDTCKALRKCADVNSAQFNQICGFCTEVGQGIPIGANGQPLYPEGNLTNCSQNAIIRQASQCPAPTAVGGSMLQDKTCTPIQGKLPVDCVERILREGGCMDRGALAVALDSGARPGDYMASARVLPSLTLYNRHMNPPLDVALFAQPGPTVRDALSEHVRRLASNASSQPATSAIGAAARDLCLQRGAIDQFDFCSELADGTLPPYSLDCVRKLFLRESGNPAGTLYPTEQTMVSTYNALPNWKAVKTFITGLRAAATGTVDGFVDIGVATQSGYRQQSQALERLRGIRPEQLGNRPPAAPGVEMFWFDTLTNVLLNVTLDPYFPTYSWDAGPIPQAFERQSHVQFVGLTDIRVLEPTSMKFKFITDDGVIMTLNKPIDVNGPNSIDNADTFAANFIQGAREYANKTCWSMTPAQSNIVKVYWHDKGGGHHTFSLVGSVCSGAGAVAYEPIRRLYLTREVSGPILQFENTPQGDFGDLRMPEFFAFNKFGNGRNNVQINAKADDKLRAPGKNGFLRIAGGQSFLALKNLSMTAWTAMTFVFRLQTAPVNDTLLSMRMTGGGQVVQVYLTPSTTGTCAVNYMTNVGGTQQTQQTGVRLSTGRWYMGVIQQIGVPATSISIVFNELDSVLASTEDWHRHQSRGLNITNRGATITNAPEQTEIVLGTQSGGSLQWDLAWWHVFNTEIRGSMLQRDAMNNWRLA